MITKTSFINCALLFSFHSLCYGNYVRLLPDVLLIMLGTWCVSKREGLGRLSQLRCTEYCAARPGHWRVWGQPGEGASPLVSLWLPSLPCASVLKPRPPYYLLLSTTVSIFVSYPPPYLLVQATIGFIWDNLPSLIHKPLPLPSYTRLTHPFHRLLQCVPHLPRMELGVLL